MRPYCQENPRLASRRTIRWQVHEAGRQEKPLLLWERRQHHKGQFMSWLIDNANTIYLLLGIVAAGLVIAWKMNQRVRFLGYAAGVLVLIALVWLLTQFTAPTDRKQLEDNVNAMSQAIIDGKTDELFKHISRDFRYKDMTRDIL